jgi:hypothetical protein
MIYIGHNNKKSQAHIVKAYFISKYNIPRELIKVKRSNCEEKEDNRYLQLCINQKGELIQLSSNIDFKIKSLSIFKQPD